MRASWGAVKGQGY
ncbi:hypothetical protein F383_37926 [Gossypium arboreum]|uniref:Uncharacterized protein n=1 Tax=Gossypium arboreum TaxID=29729 RepID=A0A0B0MHX5_GOSAR|nr:hypothetical protein F383_37926 [Gossypium arboreum]